MRRSLRREVHPTSDTNPEKTPSGPTVGWKAGLFIAGYGLWRLSLRDYSGVVFATVALLFIVVKPAANESVGWRKNARRLGIATYVLLMIVGAWRAHHR